MGWLLKGAGVVFAFILIGVGQWQIALVIFALLLIPPVLRIGKSRGAAKEGGKPRGKFPVRYALGGLLLLLAAAASFAQGTYSPYVLGSLGLLVVLWGQLPVSVIGSGFRPAEESILLRSSPFPFWWAAVAQVKPLTRDIGRALAGVTGTVVVSAAETPSIYVVVERFAPTHKAAEDAILASLRDTAVSLSALGAYLLPLDSKGAATVFRPSLETSEVGEGEWSMALASGIYDILSIRQEKGFARGLGFYRRTNQGREGRCRIPLSSEQARPPFLVEVYKAVGGRLSWPNPDQYTAFLSSLLATSGEPIGTRIADAGEGSQSQMVLVKSQGSPRVELSRAQLRAVVRIYDKGTK